MLLLQSNSVRKDKKGSQNKMEGGQKGCAIVTGSSRGIGLEIAKQLARDGYPVVITSRGSEDRYRKNLQYFVDHHMSYLYVQGDVSLSGDRERLVAEAVAHFGTIRVLVNNAGVAPLERVDLLNMSEASFDRVMSINLKGPMFLTQLVAKAMIAHKKKEEKATIINVTSCSSERISTNRGEYCMSKAAETMMSKLYAVALAQENILVHEVRPGVIQTDMTSSVQEKYDRLIQEGYFPLKRWGVARDVANVVSLLCSDKMSFSTGNYIDVDGGLHLPRL
jgi:NAD(P)-dependent dehydrogenase (short-subunit alcohol dehydrogenase family)